MLDPDPTGVMKRRIAAFAVDFGLVAVLTALVGWSQVETFSG